MCANADFLTFVEKLFHLRRDTGRGASDRQYDRQSTKLHVPQEPGT